MHERRIMTTTIIVHFAIVAFIICHFICQNKHFDHYETNNQCLRNIFKGEHCLNGKLIDPETSSG